MNQAVGLHPNPFAIPLELNQVFRSRFGGELPIQTEVSPLIQEFGLNYIGGSPVHSLQRQKQVSPCQQPRIGVACWVVEAGLQGGFAALGQDLQPQKLGLRVNKRIQLHGQGIPLYGPVRQRVWLLGIKSGGNKAASLRRPNQTVGLLLLGLPGQLLYWRCRGFYCTLAELEIKFIPSGWQFCMAKGVDAA